MVWAFNQTELDWDGKRFFQWTFQWLFFFFLNILNSKRWGQRMIIPGSHVPSRVLHCLQESLFLPAKFFSHWTLKAYSALANIHSSLWCNRVLIKIIRKCRVRQAHNWKDFLKGKQKEKKAKERYENWSEYRVLKKRKSNLKTGG